jgi:signal transduction histidine kinase
LATAGLSTSLYLGLPSMRRLDGTIRQGTSVPWRCTSTRVGSHAVPPDDDDAPNRLAALGEIAAEVAHELRNLLQVISSSAFVARVEVDRGDTATARTHVTKVERSAHVAHALVNDLLSLARGDALHKEVVRLADVAVDARADLPADAASWTDAIVPEGLEVRAHPRLLARLLHALYENAVLASSPRVPAVTTRAALLGDRVVIDVSDDGPGIPEALAARIFEPLFTGRQGGTGLGLALARRIAAAHGATLALAVAPEQDGASGPGATFRLDLPR